MKDDVNLNNLLAYIVNTRLFAFTRTSCCVDSLAAWRRGLALHLGEYIFML